MTDKELQRLRRSELLEILLSQQKQIESLKKELAEAKEQLEDRKLVMARSGSIAEAALKLNGIFEAAQRAADQYLFSIGATDLSKKNGYLTGFDATGITGADQSCYTPNVPAQADPLSNVNESLQDDEGESNEPVTDDSVADWGTGSPSPQSRTGSKKRKNREGIRLMTERVKKADMPTLEQLQKEVDRVHYRRDFSRVMINTIYSLVVVAAIAVLVAVLLLPILRIYGHSMNDTLDEGDIVVSLKGSDFRTGDIIAFYYNNKILIKRVIGKAGDWVDIDQDGNVYVNGNLIDEPYLDDKAFGECNIELPYQVPESKVFVMGDNRSVSVDSRNTAVGCVAEEQIVGKVVYRLWPLKDFGKLK